MFIGSHQVNERYLNTLQKKINLQNRKTNVIIQGIEDEYEVKKLKRNLFQFCGIKEHQIKVSSKDNFKKITDTKNIMRQATGRKMNLKEYTIEFTMIPEEIKCEENSNNEESSELGL